MAMTFGALGLAYLEIGLKGRPSYYRYSQIFKTHFAAWHERPLHEIHRYHIMELNQQFKDHPAQGNKVVGFIKQAFAWGQNTINPASHRPYWEETNPAVDIDRHKCFNRERLMDRTEIKTLLQEIGHFKLKYHAFYVCRLLVPCRLKELCGMRRDAVSDTGKWSKGKTKNGRPHVIHVPQQALELLHQLPATWFDRQHLTRIAHDYYFTGAYGRPLSSSAVQKQWRQHRAAIDMEDLWLLDFRRTLHTYLYRVMKVDDLTAKALLNHYDSRPVAIYVRLDYDYLAAILQGYADWVWQFKQEVTHEGAFSLGSFVGSPGVRLVGGGDRERIAAGRTGPAAASAGLPAAVVEQPHTGPTGTV